MKRTDKRMTNSGLKEEEHCAGEVFIKAYNKRHGTDYGLQPNTVAEDTYPDLIFLSSAGKKLEVEVTEAVTSEEEEKTISKSLKESSTAWITGDTPGEEIIFHALEKKRRKDYANSEQLILAVYRFRPIALPRNFKVPENINVPFKEVWFVDPRQKHRSAMRIYP